MPRFYFHVLNGNGETCDDEGVELPGLREAREQALTGIRSILRDEIGKGTLHLRGVLRIADAEHVLMEIRFDEAVEVRHNASTRRSRRRS